MTASLLLFAILLISGGYVAYIDFTTYRIPNKAILIAILAALAVHGLFQREKLYIYLPTGLIGFTFFLLIAMAKPGSLGMGDVKLVALLGLILGPQKLLVCLIFGSVLAIFYALIRRIKNAPLPYGPFLVIGAFVVYWLPLSIFYAI